MIRRGKLLAAALFTASVIAPARASADAASDARKVFDAAQKLFDQSRQADALPLFREVYAATKSPNARLMVARCLIAMGRMTEAYEEMSATTREATASAEKDSKYARTRDAAAAELALLERRVGKIVVALADAGAGATVTLDGAPLAADRIGVPIAVEPGTRRIEAIRADGKPVRREIAVAAGETKTVAIALTADVAPIPPPKSEAASAPLPERGGGVRIAGYVVTALGAGGLAMFGVTAAMASSKFSTLEKECGGKRCTDPRYGDVVDSGKTLDKLSIAGLAAGIPLVVGGALMIALGGPKRAPAVAIDVLPGGVMIGARGGF